MKTEVVAVVTGDIVNSTKLSKPSSKKLYQELNKVMNGFENEFYRGDSLQILITDIGQALETALKLRIKALEFGSSKLHIDIRFSIGIGKATLPVKSVLTATDEAFVISGRTLDSLSKNQTLAIVSHQEEFNQTLRLISDFADYVMRTITAKQAVVMAEAISQRTQIEIASRLRKSQATVNKQLKAAGWGEIQQLLTEYKTVCAKLKTI